MSLLAPIAAEMPAPAPAEEHEEPGDIGAAIERTAGKFIPVDTASLLLVDPCHLPADILEKLTTPNEYGMSLAVVIGTHADGAYYFEPAEGDNTGRFFDVWRD